jgi:DnaJ-class molecular chaperone
MSESFYKILGVDEKSSKEEIKKAYRGLQMKYHPDKNFGSQEAISMTQKLNEAYETLGDEEKREEYDMTRNNPFFRQNGGGMDVPIDELFSTLFGIKPFGGGMGGMGGMGGFPGMHQGIPPGAKVHFFQGGPMNFQQGMQKPTPILKTINIKISQVLTGAIVPLEIERWLMENGMKVFEKETIYVTVPKGIDDGELIVLRDKGNILNEQCKGDLKIFIKIENDTLFNRVGLDLVLEKNITLKDALCGFSFEITYINGKSYTLNNNPGNIIPPGFRKIIPNLGLERDEHKGNMVIVFNVQFPEKLTEEQMKKIRDSL